MQHLPPRGTELFILAHSNPFLFKWPYVASGCHVVSWSSPLALLIPTEKGEKTLSVFWDRPGKWHLSLLLYSIGNISSVEDI